MARTPGGSAVFDNYRFEIDNGCRECDYWVVWGGLKKMEKVKCPAENVIYATDETHAQRRFDHAFLDQFFFLVACRTDLHHPRVIRSHDLGIWHFNKTYDEVLALRLDEKSRQMSVVCSDLTMLPGHIKRLNYVKYLMNDLGGHIDCFGRGINPIADKYDALADYKYSVCIENSCIEGYFTEKLFECFLTDTFPVYYGCPNIAEYFDDRAFISIDIDDYKGSAQTVFEVMNSDLRRARLPYLREAKELYLKKYFFFPAIINHIEGNSHLRERKPKDTIALFPEEYFTLSSVEYCQKAVQRGIMNASKWALEKKRILTKR